jgi:hypothetical protein
MAAWDRPERRSIWARRSVLMVARSISSTRASSRQQQPNKKGERHSWALKASRAALFSWASKVSARWAQIRKAPIDKGKATTATGRAGVTKARREAVAAPPLLRAAQWKVEEVTDQEGGRNCDREREDQAAAASAAAAMAAARAAPSRRRSARAAAAAASVAALRAASSARRWLRVRVTDRGKRRGLR